jgi:hypothetical protein
LNVNRLDSNAKIQIKHLTELRSHLI